MTSIEVAVFKHSARTAQ